uniref:Uncharacterized protein n=1 Tax=Nothobranchius furzeri TaxID=105023 RepID=A0A8C6KCB1_NOTFU
MTQSGCSMSFRRWQELVVTELAPAHHSREKSHCSLTTHRFTDTFCLRSSLSDKKSSSGTRAQHVNPVVCSCGKLDESKHKKSLPFSISFGCLFGPLC